MVMAQRKSPAKIIMFQLHIGEVKNASAQLGRIIAWEVKEAGLVKFSPNGALLYWENPPHGPLFSCTATQFFQIRPEVESPG